MINFENESKLSLTIIVMDENVHGATFLKQSLVYLGHTVFVFHHVTEALDAYRKSPNEFDVLITDGELFNHLDGVAKYSGGKKNSPEDKAFIHNILSIRSLPILICCLYSTQIDAIKSQLPDATSLSFFDKSEKNSVKHLNTWLNNLNITRSHQEESFPIYQLIYASKVSEGFSEEDLLDILQYSRQNNKKKQISGAMIYSKGYFLQMLEGRRNTVNELFNQHIANDQRHQMVNCFFQSYVEEREFPNWYMGFFKNEDNEGLDLLDLIDFKAHPAGKFFREKLALTQKQLHGKYPIPPDYLAGNEVSWIMEAMCSPSMRLIFDMTHNTQVAFEALRLKLGLDCLKTGVMMTDDEQNIIYVNHSAMTLFHAAQDELQKILPNFSAAHLMGKNIDFLSVITKQMHLFNVPEDNTSNNHVLNIGDRFLRINVSKIVDEYNKQLGFAIEIDENTAKNVI